MSSVRIGEAMTEKETVEFRAFLPKKVHKLLKMEAADQDQSMNDLIIMAVIEYLEKK